MVGGREKKRHTQSDNGVDGASTAAHDVTGLLDQRVFVLDDERYERLLQILENPPAPTKDLRELLSRKAPWSRD